MKVIESRPELFFGPEIPLVEHTNFDCYIHTVTTRSHVSKSVILPHSKTSLVQSATTQFLYTSQHNPFRGSSGQVVHGRAPWNKQ